MYKSKAIVILLAAFAEARFGQEQGNGAIAAIGALTQFGSSGQAATLSGGSIQFLLAAANPCGKLTQADTIVSTLGTDDAVIAAARGLVAAEQNFNPFVVSVPSVCSDPTLPTTVALRGVVPLIDPAVGGEATENANSDASKITPFSADGLSVAQVMVAQGFSNFTAVDLNGNKVAASTLGGTSSDDSGADEASSSTVLSTAAASSTTVPSSTAVDSGDACGTTLLTVTRAPAAAASTSSSLLAAAGTLTAAASASTEAAGSCTGSGSTLVCTSPAVGSGAVTDAVTGNFDGFVASTIAGLDFGSCVPTIKFEAGLNGRATTAFTFQAIDPLVNKGQQEALNPNIITNRIFDQLTNVCGANEAAKTATTAAQAQIAALGTRDAATADAWNTALGFEGTNTNPDNAPVTGLVGHT